MKRFLPVIFVLLLSTILTNVSFALELQSIGALSLGGKTYPEWWYSGVNPTFAGTAEKDSEVKVTIDNTTYDATTNSSGIWSVNTTEPAGDYNVTVAGDGTTYAFTLHLGQNVPANLGTTTTEGEISTTVPSTGSNQLVSILFSAGILLLVSYFYFWGSRPNTKSQFEKYFLNS